MGNNSEFDAVAAHRFFSAQCFNKAWDLIDKADRSPEENQQMIQLNQASLWHWSQREDCTPRNLSVGYWQASRIHALLGDSDDAYRYAQLSLANSEGEDPFYAGYAYEALARAAMVSGDTARMKEYLSEARKWADTITDEESRSMLVKDLDTITLSN
jgi:hypothetical protein